MPNLTSIGVANGVPVSGTGTVSTIDALLAAQNANLNVNSSAGVVGNFGAPVASLDYYGQYKTVAANTTAKLGSTGAQNDYLAGVLVIPQSNAPGAVTIQDGNGSAITIFVGGAASISDLKPFLIPLGLFATSGTSAGWTLTTGLNMTAIGIGRFT